MSSPLTAEEQRINEKPDLGSLSVKDLFFKYIRFLPVFLLCLTLTLFGAWVYLRYAPPIYRASGELRIKNDKQAGGSGDEKLNQLALNTGTENIQNEIEVLKSKPLMERVVNALNLQVDYRTVGKIKSQDIFKQGPFLLDIFEVADSSKSFTLDIKFIQDTVFKVDDDPNNFSFGELFKNRYGVFRLIRNSFSSPGKEYKVSWTPTASVAGGLAGLVQVAPKNNTDILTITIETTNAQKSSDVVDQLMIEYGEMTKEDKSAEAALTLMFVDTSIKSVQHEIDSIQKKQTNFEKENNLIDLDNQSKNYLDQMAVADQNVKDQRVLINISELIENYLNDKQNDYKLVPSSLILKDATLDGKIDEYNKAQLERAALLESHIPENNPALKEATQIIQILHGDILEAVKNVKKATALTMNDYQQRFGAVKDKVKALPPQIIRLNEFKTLLDSKMGVYQYLMEKKLETTISKASTLSNSKIIERPFPSSQPVKPNPQSIRLLAILAGIGIPAFFIFLLEMVNDRVTTRTDIEKITRAPVLGEIGHSYADSSLVVRKTNRGMVAEQFRIIRSNLQYVLTRAEKQIILVTSSFSGEGKSFITINVGAVMALAGKKTIVLEFDIRKPKILTGLGLSRRSGGITNYLLGKAKLEDLPIQVPGHENLYVLSCGPVPPNPSELLLDDRVAELFAYLKQNFDVVLIDTAPVGMVSDAMTLGKFADCSLYIVRQGHTYKKQVALIDEFYTAEKLPKVSIVINDVKIKPGYGYYGYGRYGYGYGYKSNYYEEEETSHNFFSRLFSVFDRKRHKNERSDES